MPVRVERRRHTGIMGAGISLLSIGYGGAFVTGAVLAGISGGSSSRDRSFATGAGLLLIPIVGPFISSVYMPSATDPVSSLYWSLPWMFTSAGLHAAHPRHLRAGQRCPLRRPRQIRRPQFTSLRSCQSRVAAASIA